MKKYILLLLLSTTLWAQIPDGYYNDASGLTGTTLQQALHDIIDDHTVVSYGSLWTHYQTTDVKPNGKVWDMYSHIPDGDQPYEFTFVSDQCGNYGAEGDCYNREHSWPKSWFNDVAPMNTDIFHVVPSDGYVNGQRGNYPYGEVDSPTWTSQNGSKKGPNTYPGYSGTVFEPIDAYKGDFARAYFYMSTRYLNEDSSWPGSPMVDGAQMEPWALDMMMEWHTEDPVSQKELDRNDANYGVQNNRNPFVDYPTYVDLIWGDPPVLPLAPTDLVASSITNNSAELNWTDNADDEDGYYLYQSGQLVETLPSGATYVLLENLSPLQTYNYAVSCFNVSGESASTSYSFTTLGGGDSIVTHFEEGFEIWSGSGSSYFDGDIELSSGTWNVYKAGNYTLGDPPYAGNYTIAINDDTPEAHITTPAVNTLGTVSFYYYQRNGAATDEFQLQKSDNGAAFEMVSTSSYNVGTTYTLFSAVLNDTSSSVKVRIVNDNQTGHLIIDNFSVTHYDPVSIDDRSTLSPPAFYLNPAYPNPFNPEVQLSINVESAESELSLDIFDLRGEHMATIVNGHLDSGTHNFTWSGKSMGKDIPAGIYLVRLTNGSVTQFQRITLLK
ncbi:MAG: endonuclease [Candidatus Marinimicrobia bacterium]|nr:endonuclease [Candidatus Neomarinimicrobiota bacterium]